MSPASSSNLTRLLPRSFISGQYVHLSVPGTDQHRSYSFANASFETGEYTFYIKVLEQGAMSDYLSKATPGDEMTVSGPFGRFYLRPAQRPIVMVAGGTGLAPMLSMLDTLVAQEETQQPVRLLYGAIEPGELFGLDQIAGYAAQGLDITTELHCRARRSLGRGDGTRHGIASTGDTQRWGLRRLSLWSAAHD